MELGSELETRIRLHLLHPQPNYFGLKMLIKRAVDLHGIEPPRQKFKRVEPAPVDLRVN
jgi:hypothetical protein